jgi:hypothetical protein
MNGQKFHFFDATVDLFNPSETNFASRSSDVNPLFFRVIQALRAYCKERVPGRRGITAGHLSLREGDGEG